MDMRVDLHKWEVERVKNIVAGILDFYQYDSIEVRSEHNAMSMSIETFLENLERDLKDPHK